MNPGQEELINYFYAIVERTHQGSVVWSQAAPTAFVCVRETASGPKRMIIQRASRRGGDSDFLFQVKSIGRDEGGELAIDTNEKPYLRPIFASLYEAAESSIDSQTARILRDLLGE